MTYSKSTPKRLILGIMLALVIWGIYIAIGATGIFVHRSLFDVRKSFIVLLCVCLFLGFWVLVLWSHRDRQGETIQASGADIDASTPPPRRWSWAGIASFAATGLGLGVWGLAIFSWRYDSPATTTILGWLAAFGFMGAATAGMIALSDRQRRRGKWLGLLGLLVCACALLGYVVRMTP